MPRPAMKMPRTIAEIQRRFPDAAIEYVHQTLDPAAGETCEGEIVIYTGLTPVDGNSDRVRELTDAELGAAPVLKGV